MQRTQSFHEAAKACTSTTLPPRHQAGYVPGQHAGDGPGERRPGKTTATDNSTPEILGLSSEQREVVWRDCSLANLANRGNSPNFRGNVQYWLYSQTLEGMFNIGCTVNSPIFLLPTCFERQFAKLKSCQSKVPPNCRLLQ